MRGLLADENVLGDLPFLCRLLARLDLWEILRRRRSSLQHSFNLVFRRAWMTENCGSFANEMDGFSLPATGTTMARTPSKRRSRNRGKWAIFQY